MLSPPPEYLIIKKDILMYYIKEVYTEEYSWRLVLYSVHTCYTSGTLSCILEENFQKLARLVSHFFFVIFVSRWINSNKFKFELVHLHKNIKTKENYFKKFYWCKTKYNTVYSKHLILYRHLYSIYFSCL